MSKTARGSDQDSGEKKANVLVCVRVRPMNRLELRTKQVEAWTYKDDCQITQTVAAEEKKSEKKSNNLPKAVPADFAFGELSLYIRGTRMNCVLVCLCHVLVLVCTVR